MVKIVLKCNVQPISYVGCLILMLIYKYGSSLFKSCKRKIGK